MKTSHLELSPEMQNAIDEVTAIISASYPTTTFVTEPGVEPDSVFVQAFVDAIEPDDVMDLYISRLVTIQVEEGIPLYVFARRTPERLLEYRQSLSQNRKRPA